MAIGGGLAVLVRDGVVACRFCSSPADGDGGRGGGTTRALIVDSRMLSRYRGMDSPSCKHSKGREFSEGDIHFTLTEREGMQQAMEVRRIATVAGLRIIERQQAAEVREWISDACQGGKNVLRLTSTVAWTMREKAITTRRLRSPRPSGSGQPRPSALQPRPVVPD